MRERLCKFARFKIEERLFAYKSEIMNIKEISYVSPTAKAVEICALCLICTSGNEPMEEHDNGHYGEW